MPNQVRVGFGITGASKAESDLDRLRNKITGIQKAGAGGVAKGVGIGIGLGLLNQATLAVGGLTNAIGDATAAAIADEESQQRLKTTLKATIPAWDGNTSAIEKVLEARIKLGFSDDEQRESLATLVTATGDVTTALDLERGAMDLARKANVSLETASDAVAKAFGGQDKQLKTLLPGLQRGKTSADTLANAFAAARGQADDYSTTMGGKVLVSQTKLNEAMEKLGYVIAPALADALTGLVEVMEGVGSGLENIAEVAQQAGEGIDKGLIKPIADATEAFQDFANGSSENFDKVDADLDRASRKVTKLTSNIKHLKAISPVEIKVYTKVIGGVEQNFSSLSGGPRASGGPVRPDRSYYVGEEGPEKFTPDVPGTISPTGSGGDTYNLTFTGSIGQSADNIIAQVNRMRYYSRSRKAA